jgi:anti-sigma factor RsiW
MNEYDDETLLAYVDGELDDAAREAFERTLATDPALARRVEVQRRLRRELKAAFDPTLSEPVPDGLLLAARGSSTRDAGVVRWPAKARRPATWNPPRWFAVAASLVVGVLLGRQVLAPQSPETYVASGPEGMVATDALATALSRQLAAERSAPITIGVSYLATSGDYCRSFEIRGATTAQAGLACHARGGAWQVRILESIPDVAADTNLRQARSAALPASVRTLVEATIAGDALDANAEAAARDAGWESSPRR